MPELTLVVGNHEGERFLDGCVESARAQTLPPSEIVLVDADSKDGSRARAQSLGARVVHVENRGLAVLYNRGAEVAKSDLVLFSNTDVVFDRRCFELLAAALEAEPTAFAADPRQLDWNGEREVHARTALRRGRLVREWLPGLHVDHVSPAGKVVPTVSAHGAAMLVDRRRFAALGGFDETFFLDFEDLDLCWRAWLRGWATLYVPGARLRHRVGGVTSRAVVPRRLASSHHNILRFALKCLPARTAATVVVGELLRTPAHPRTLPPALWAVARELPEILRLRRRIRPSRALLEWMLAGQIGDPPALP